MGKKNKWSILNAMQKTLRCRVPVVLINKKYRDKNNLLTIILEFRVKIIIEML
jgi:hypothetical protein